MEIFVTEIFIIENDFYDERIIVIEKLESYDADDFVIEISMKTSYISTSSVDLSTYC